MSLSKVESTPELILKLIPQRYPFMMIDKLLEHEFRVRAKCLKNITFGEEVFTGHFPGNPIYPGVLLIEMGLQATQIMLSDLEKINQSKEDAAQGFVVKVEDFKFQGIVSPGDTLEVTAEFKEEVMNMIISKITIKTTEGQKIAKGKVVVGEKEKTS